MLEQRAPLRIRELYNKADGRVVFFVVDNAICIACCLDCLATGAAFVVHLVCERGWLELEVQTIVLFQILRSFLRKPHTSRFLDDVPVKVTAEQEL
jgi:hypothetical protein